MLNNYGRENNFQELVADSLVHKPCGKLRIKGSQRTPPSCSKQMSCSTFCTSNRPCTTSCLGREQEERQRQLGVFSTFFSLSMKENNRNASKSNTSPTLKVLAVNLICGCCLFLCDTFLFTPWKWLHNQCHSWASQPRHISENWK